MNIYLRLFLTAAVYILGLSSTYAATLNVSGTGKLLGASGVVINGTSYDVAFQDGTCGAVFSGCDQVSDFLFTSQAAANAASQALLDQVLLDVPAQGYAFDSTPSSVYGCSSVVTVRCIAFTPYSLFTNSKNQPAVNTSYADNESSTSTKLDFVANVGHLLADDTGSATWQIAVWAVWSPTPATPEVPVPAAAWLFGSGLIGLAGLARNRSNAVA